MQELHSAASSRTQTASAGSPEVQPLTRQAAGAQSAAFARPFATIGEVTEGSPASSAGLIAGDRIIAFGDITLADLTPLQSMARHLQVGHLLLRNAHALSIYAFNLAMITPTRDQEKQGQPVTVMLLRRGGTRELQLTPQRWSGQGLLGARVLPLQA